MPVNSCCCSDSRHTSTSDWLQYLKDSPFTTQLAVKLDTAGPQLVVDITLTFNCSRNFLGVTQLNNYCASSKTTLVENKSIKSHKPGSNASLPRQLAVRLLLLAEPAVVTITAFANVLGKGVDIAGPVRRVDTDHLDDKVDRTQSCCYRGCG